MNLSIEKQDFKNLEKIVSINSQYFTPANDYIPKVKRLEAKALQKPVWNKMKMLKNSLIENTYFGERFEIIVSRPNKQSSKTVKGNIRRLVWVSLANITELKKKNNGVTKHIHIPQLQISFQHDRIIMASIWLEGNNCKQIYREKFLKYLGTRSVNDNYKLVIYDKKEDTKEYEGLFSNLTSEKFLKFMNGRNFSIGLCRILTPAEAIALGEDLYNSIISELQWLNETILIPCYNFTQNNNKIKTKKNEKTKRKEAEKFDIKNSLRKGIEPTVVTKKHKSIQNDLYDLFQNRNKGLENIIKLEKDFVDLRIENPSNKSMIIYEIKTDKTALNCIKQGLGQLVFYNLLNRNLGWQKIELVIVGTPKLTSKEKEYVKSIKEFLGYQIFRYQRFDEKKKALLDEKKS